MPWAHAHNCSRFFFNFSCRKPTPKPVRTRTRTRKDEEQRAVAIVWTVLYRFYKHYLSNSTQNSDERRIRRKKMKMIRYHDPNNKGAPFSPHLFFKPLLKTYFRPGRKYANWSGCLVFQNWNIYLRVAYLYN